MEKTLLAQSLLNTLESELNAVLGELAPLLEEYNSREVERIIDTAAICEIFDRLQPMLLAKNPECEDMLGEIRGIAGSGKLADNIENYKFKQAYDDLARLKQELGIDC